MPVYGLVIAVQNPETKKVWITHRDYELSDLNFLVRGSVKDAFKFLARESLPCLQRNARASVIHEDKICHMLCLAQPVAAFAFVPKEYPERIVFTLLKKSLDIFKNAIDDKWKAYSEDIDLKIAEISETFRQFQDPTKADKLALAQSKVDEVQCVLYESINKLLERQGDLNDLVKKSQDLSGAAKEFYDSSKKMNKSCCSLI